MVLESTGQQDDESSPSFDITWIWPSLFSRCNRRGIPWGATTSGEDEEDGRDYLGQADSKLRPPWPQAQHKHEPQALVASRSRLADLLIPACHRPSKLNKLTHLSPAPARRSLARRPPILCSAELAPLPSRAQAPTHLLESCPVAVRSLCSSPHFVRRASSRRLPRCINENKKTHVILLKRLC